MSVCCLRHHTLTILFSLLVLTLAWSVRALANETDQDTPVGAVGGAVHADLFTGMATTSIPIEVSPGRQGVQPELSLVYSSANGNGWVGMGWKLEKGVIERQTKFGVDYNGDDYVFRLSGINVELVNIGNDEYRAKIEGGFTRVEKITANDGKPYFEATDRTGKKFYFGQAANTRVADPNDANKIFRWCLDRVEDPNGNYMILSYINDQGQAYLDTISYTGNDSLAPTNTVKFYLEDRPDAPPMYVPNYLMKTAKRLKTIEVKANGSLVRAYKLTYSTSAKISHSLLNSVQQFGRDTIFDNLGGITGGSSNPPVQITYGGEHSSGNWKSFSSFTPPYHLAADGLGDMGSRFIDLNGDGRMDFVYHRWISSSQKHKGAYLNTGTGWVSAPAFTPPYHLAADGLGDMGSRFIDLNGDGRMDFVYHRWISSSQKHKGAYVTTNIPELIQSISNGLGATTKIEYAPSTLYTNTQLPFPVQTVFKITTDDGNGNVATTRYNYSAGFHHIAERDFRGFHYVKVTGPTGPSGEQTITETWFHQGNDTAEGVNNPNVPDGYLKGAPYRTKVTDGAGNLYTQTTTTYTDDTDGQAPFFAPSASVVTDICDGNGCSKTTRTDFTYDVYGNITREDQYGDIATATDDRTVVRTFTHNTTDWLVSLPTSETIYRGLGAGNQVARTDFYYDGTTNCAVASANQQPIQGNLTRVVRWLNGGTSPDTRMAYDAMGNVICTRDANGHTTTMAYDASGTFATTVANPLGHLTNTQYYGVNGVPMDAGLYGQVKTVTDLNGAIVSTSYDTLGRRTSVTQPDGFWTTTSYNSFGTVGAQHVRTDSSLGLSTWTYFDGLGRTIKEKSTGTDTKIIVTDTEYDARGAVMRTSTPYFETGGSPLWSMVTYDPMGRAIQTVNPDGSRVLGCFDDWVTVTIDANNHKKRSVRDAYGHVTTVQEYLGDFTRCTTAVGSPYATTTYRYDVLGNLLTLTDAKGNVSTMAYDTLSRKTIMHDPGMGTWTYDYDANGNLTRQTDAKRQQIHFHYDNLNRRVQKDYDMIKALGSGDVVYIYDGSTNNRIGRLQSVDDSSGTTTFFYDVTGRVTRTDKVIDSTTYTTQSTYDGLGRVTAITYPDTSVVTQTYNGPQLKEVKEDSITYASYGGFNALGQPTTLTLGNGVTTTYTYDPTNFRLKILKTVNGSTVLQDLGYTFDAGGNVTALTDATHGNQTFGYDDLDRLTSATGTYGTISYTYNEIGNMLSNSQVGTFSYPVSGPSSLRPHAVTSAGTNTYTYDANGNMTSGAGRTITYNHENRPVSMTTSGGGTGDTMPSITNQPVDAIVTAPNSATFTVTATGSPAPTYQWQRDDVDIAGATQASYTLNPTTVADTGAKFRVVVSNTVGNMTSAEATLTVQSASATAPTVVQHEKTQGIFANTHAVTLTVTPGQRLLAFTGSVRLSSGSGNPAALSVTWNGTEALTEVQNTTKGPRARVQAWVLETPSAGTFVLEAQWDSADAQRHLHGVVIDGAGPGITNVATTTQSNATAITSTAVSSTTGHRLIDFGLYEDNEDLTWTPHSGQTQQGDYSRLTLVRKSRAAVSTKPGTPSTDLGWDTTGGGTASNLLHLVMDVPPNGGQASLPSESEDSRLMLAAVGPDHTDRMQAAPTAQGSVTTSRLSAWPSAGSATGSGLEDASGSVNRSSSPYPVALGAEELAFANYVRLTAFRAQASTLSSGVNHVAAVHDAKSKQLEEVLVRIQSSPPPVSLTTTFVYDGDGGRVKKTVDDGSMVTATTYIGKLYVCEGTALPLSCAKMIFAGSQRIAMAQVDSGSISYFHSDHLGSTSVLTDGSGTIDQDVAYYPYGDARSNTGTADVAYKYTGKEQDVSTGLYFYEARYYDPVLGRFNSADTVVPEPLNPQSLNRYSYVLNNPFRYTDPSGHFFKSVFKAISKAFESPIVRAVSWAVLPGAAVYADPVTRPYAISVSAAAVGTVAAGPVGAKYGFLAGSTVAGFVSSTTNAFASKAVGYDVDIGRMIAAGTASGIIRGFGGLVPGPVLGPVGRIGFRGLAGGTVSSILGGSFKRGFAFAGGATLAREVYLGITGFSGINPGPGGKALPKPAGSPDAFEYANNIGDAVPSQDLLGKVGWCSEASTCSKLLNLLPGINATAGFHDNLTGDDILGKNLLSNYPTMLPSFALTVAGAVDGISLGGNTYSLTLPLLINLQNKQNSRK